MLKPCMPAHLLAEVERVLRHAKLMNAALGQLRVGAEPALPVGSGTPFAAAARSSLRARRILTPHQSGVRNCHPDG